MDKEKEIEEMAKVLFLYQDNVCGGCGSEQTCNELGYGECGIFNSMAKVLINAGIGDKKQAVKEFAEKSKKRISILTVGDDEAEMFRFGFETLQEHLPEEIDNLITELYGANE